MSMRVSIKLYMSNGGRYLTINQINRNVDLIGFSWWDFLRWPSVSSSMATLSKHIYFEICKRWIALWQYLIRCYQLLYCQNERGKLCSGNQTFFSVGKIFPKPFDTVCILEWVCCRFGHQQLDYIDWTIMATNFEVISHQYKMEEWTNGQTHWLSLFLTNHSLVWPSTSATNT